MLPKESFYSADWLRIAEKDLKRVELLLNVHDPEAVRGSLEQVQGLIERIRAQVAGQQRK